MLKLQTTGVKRLVVAEHKVLVECAT